MQWQELYAACVSETDSDRLEKLVYETEGAMFLRFQELACEPLAWDEVQELKQAATGLLEFKVEQLGWPDPMKAKRRRKHHHFRVTVRYSDRAQSAKVFINRELAQRFAERQSESPAVTSAQVMVD